MRATGIFATVLLIMTTSSLAMPVADTAVNSLSSSAFDKVTINSVYPVTITQQRGDLPHVTVTADSAAAKSAVSAAITHGTLYINDKNVSKALLTQHIAISVQLSELEKLTMNGAAPLTVTGLSTPMLTIENNSPANITIDGHNIGLQQVTVNDVGSVRVSGVNTPILAVKTSGHATGSVNLSGPSIALTSLDNAGLGGITISNLQPMPLTVTTNNQCPVNLTGKVDLIALTATGSGDVNIDNINSDTVAITASGSGSINLFGKKIGLTKVTASNAALVHAFGVNATNLEISAADRANVTLVGMAGLNVLTATDRSQVDVLWLMTNKAKITAKDQSQVRLAGIAEELDTTSADKARLDLKFLRTNSVYASSYGESIASFWAEQKLYARANDVSNIYYYTKPVFLANYSAESGAVLAMQY